jgi:hypothetical protein
LQSAEKAARSRAGDATGIGLTLALLAALDRLVEERRGA